MSFTLTCPSCSSPIEVKNKASLFVVCPACGTSSRRQDQNLEEYGKTAELRDDGTPFQVGSTGQVDGKKFEFVGRIQQQLPNGYWNEWYLRFNDDSGGWLSEAQGFLVFTTEVPYDQAVPTPGSLEPGQSVTIAGKDLEVKEIQKAEVISGEGELPFPFDGGYEATVVDLVDAAGNFATLDYSSDPPHFFFGKNVKFEDLKAGNLRDKEAEQYYADKKKGAQVKCKGCGANLTLRAGSFAKSIACEFCGTVTDTSGTGNALGQIKAIEENKPDMILQLGDKASFALGSLAEPDEDAQAPKSYEFIGLMVRSVSYDNIEYPWREYLFVSDDAAQTYLWLTESDGHWNLIRSLNKKVDVSAGSITYKGAKYRHFQKSKAQTKYVVGEFYWQVNVNDRPTLNDYIAPPSLLSSERSQKEIVWSEGRYMHPKEVAAATGVDAGHLPEQSGINPVQPNPIKPISKAVGRMFYGFAALAVAMAIYFHGAAAEQTVLNKNYLYNRAKVIKSTSTSPPDYGTDPKKRPFTTDRFFLPASEKNLDITISIPQLTNQWAYFEMALIPTGEPKGVCKGPVGKKSAKLKPKKNQKKLTKKKKKNKAKKKKGKKNQVNNKTSPKAKAKGSADFKGSGKALAFSKAVEYYKGSDWEEGSRSENFSLPSIDKGCYYLWIDPLVDPKIIKIGWSLQVVHDSPNAGFIFLVLLFLFIPRTILFLKEKVFEGRRWSESDYGE